MSLHYFDNNPFCFIVFISSLFVLWFLLGMKFTFILFSIKEDSEKRLQEIKKCSE